MLENKPKAAPNVLDTTEQQELAAKPDKAAKALGIAETVALALGQKNGVKIPDAMKGTSPGADYVKVLGQDGGKIFNEKRTTLKEMGLENALVQGPGPGKDPAKTPDTAASLDLPGETVELRNARLLLLPQEGKEKRTKDDPGSRSAVAEIHDGRPYVSAAAALIAALQRPEDKRNTPIEGNQKAYVETLVSLWLTTETSPAAQKLANELKSALLAEDSSFRKLLAQDPQIRETVGKLAATRPKEGVDLYKLVYDRPAEGSTQRGYELTGETEELRKARLLLTPQQGKEKRTTDDPGSRSTVTDKTELKPYSDAATTLITALQRPEDKRNTPLEYNQRVYAATIADIWTKKETTPEAQKLQAELQKQLLAENSPLRKVLEQDPQVRNTIGILLAEKSRESMPLLKIITDRAQAEMVIARDEAANREKKWVDEERKRKPGEADESRDKRRHAFEAELGNLNAKLDVLQGEVSTYRATLGRTVDYDHKEGVQLYRDLTKAEGDANVVNFRTRLMSGIETLGSNGYGLPDRFLGKLTPDKIAEVRARVTFEGRLREGSLSNYNRKTVPVPLEGVLLNKPLYNPNERTGEPRQNFLDMEADVYQNENRLKGEEGAFSSWLKDVSQSFGFVADTNKDGNDRRISMITKAQRMGILESMKEYTPDEVTKLETFRSLLDLTSSSIQKHEMEVATKLEDAKKQLLDIEKALLTTTNEAEVAALNEKKKSATADQVRMNAEAARIRKEFSGLKKAAFDLAGTIDRQLKNHNRAPYESNLPLLKTAVADDKPALAQSIYLRLPDPNNPHPDFQKEMKKVQEMADGTMPLKSRSEMTDLKERTSAIAALAKEYEAEMLKSRATGTDVERDVLTRIYNTEMQKLVLTVFPDPKNEEPWKSKLQGKELEQLPREEREAYLAARGKVLTSVMDTLVGQMEGVKGPYKDQIRKAYAAAYTPVLGHHAAQSDQASKANLADRIDKLEEVSSLWTSYRRELGVSTTKSESKQGTGLKPNGITPDEAISSLHASSRDIAKLKNFAAFATAITSSPENFMKASPEEKKKLQEGLVIMENKFFTKDKVEAARLWIPSGAPLDKVSGAKLPAAMVQTYGKPGDKTPSLVRKTSIGDVKFMEAYKDLLGPVQANLKQLKADAALTAKAADAESKALLEQPDKLKARIETTGHYQLRFHLEKATPAAAPGANPMGPAGTPAKPAGTPPPTMSYAPTPREIQQRQNLARDLLIDSKAKRFNADATPRSLQAEIDIRMEIARRFPKESGVDVDPFFDLKEWSKIKQTPMPPQVKTAMSSLFREQFLRSGPEEQREMMELLLSA